MESNLESQNPVSVSQETPVPKRRGRKPKPKVILEDLLITTAPIGRPNAIGKALDKDPVVNLKKMPKRLINFRPRR